MKWYIDKGVLICKEKKAAIPFEVEDGATEIIVPEGVNALGTSVFRDCDHLTSVILPEGLSEIGTYAFYNCRQLSSISLPGSLKKIGVCAFYGCTNLAQIALPDKVREIGARAFARTGLAGIAIPDSVRLMGERVFGDCLCLTSFTVPNDKVKIEQHAFDNAGLKHLYIAHPQTNVIKEWRLGDEVMIHTDEIAAVPMNRRSLARLAYVMDRKDLTTPVGKDAARYVSSNASKYLMRIMEEPQLLHALLDAKLISARDIDAFQDAARKAGNVELIAALLDYHAKVLTMSAVVKARAEKTEKQVKEIETALERAAARANKQDLKGLVFVVSGELYEVCLIRPILKALLQHCGARLETAVTVKTDYLVKGWCCDSDKEAQAISLGVDVISEEQFRDMLYEQKDGVDFSKDGQVLVKARRDKIGSRYTVPKGVTTIADRAFFYHSQLVRITIPESVTKIGPDTFYRCPKNLVIHAPVGSYAEKYAQKHKIRLRRLSGRPQTRKEE